MPHKVNPIDFENSEGNLGLANAVFGHQKIEQKPWVLKAALFSIPLPWIAIEAGWFVAEFETLGRSLLQVETFGD